MNQSLIVGLLVIVAVVIIALVSIGARRSGRPRLHPLPDESRERHARAWQAIETRFTDDPQGAVQEADRTAVMILSERGAILGAGTNVPDDLRQAREAARGGAEGMHRAIAHYKRIVDDALVPRVKDRDARQREVAS